MRMSRASAKAPASTLIRVKESVSEKICNPHDILMLYRISLPARLVRNLNEEARYRRQTEPFHWTPDLVLRKIIEDHYLRMEHDLGLRTDHAERHPHHIPLSR